MGIFLWFGVRLCEIATEFGPIIADCRGTHHFTIQRTLELTLREINSNNSIYIYFIYIYIHEYILKGNKVRALLPFPNPQPKVGMQTNSLRLWLKGLKIHQCKQLLGYHFATSLANGTAYIPTNEIWRKWEISKLSSWIMTSGRLIFNIGQHILNTCGRLSFQYQLW